ncbi:MAG TPA: hypothetical protein VK578_22965 [Edaphobacter sp.]|nr:hypothetical protein [Edaphobacter sp.]
MEEQATAKTKYRDLSTAAALPPSVEMTFVVGVDKKKQSIFRDDKQEKQWLGKVLHSHSSR